MNRIENSWHYCTGSFGWMWSKLTGADLNTGKREWLIRNARKKYTISMAEADRRLAEWQSTQRQSPVVRNGVFSRDGKGASLERKERAMKSCSALERNTSEH